MTAQPRHAGPGRYVLLAIVALLVLAIVAAAALLRTSVGSLTTHTDALVSVQTPLGGGQIESVSAVRTVTRQAIPVELRGNQVWPREQLPVGAHVAVYVVLKRPGWLGWLTGHTERLQLSLVTPSASLVAPYVTAPPGAPLRVGFTAPVQRLSYGTPPRMAPLQLPGAESQVTLPRPAAAGSLYVAAAPRIWENPNLQVFSWFPTGAATSAVASPAPGTTLSPRSPITLTFSKPVQQALGSTSPPLLPATPGAWQQVDSHTIVFHPRGYGYGLGTHVTVALPAGVHLVMGASGASASTGVWSVPSGSTLRLQQDLALLGYLPLQFHYQGAAVARTATAQEQAALHPPAGSFSWAYPNVPSALRGFWSPGANGTMTRGAVMKFQDEHGLTPDGQAGPRLWRTLIDAVVAGRRSTFGYSFVMVNKDAQSMSLWHNGKTVMGSPVNTGVSAAPTASGTFAVFEHLPVTTMTGTNPDGSHYSDPGIQWVSYFNGGDALHAFDRATFGTPQSNGCVELPLAAAARLYPYTPIGTLVNVI